jgi:sugar phosphate isomerase/epimerase
MGAQRPAQTLLELEPQIEVCERAGTWVCTDIPHVASVFPEFPQLFAALRTLAPYVRQVHLADMVPPSHRHMPIGRGSLPLDQILNELETLGYIGTAIVEEFNKGWSPEDYLSAAVAFRDRIRDRWPASDAL